MSHTESRAMADQLPNRGADLAVKDLSDFGAGRSLGRYTLLRRIAAGGMAEVYVARVKGISGFERKVAIKKILPQHSHNKRFIEMLVDEARITVFLTHPNIAQVYELGLEGEDAYFIVMEYVDGRPLNRVMQRVDERGLGPLPLEHAVHIMSEVAKGLHHAHEQQDARGNPLSIVHRDVSPQNVLISYAGDVKLIDFGIARAKGRAAQTSVGVIKGKLRYLAPEIASGEEPDLRADVYCCGIVLFEMLTGEAMFAPRSDKEAIEMASDARVRSPRSCNGKVPTDLDEIVMRALSKRREDRYESARALHSDLRRFLNQNYPAFVGSELGDFMRSNFAEDIREEQRMEAIAEEIVRTSANRDPAEDILAVDRSSEARTAEERPRRPYKQLVTRLGINASVTPGNVNAPEASVSAGSIAMGVFPADPEPNLAALAPMLGAATELAQIRFPDPAASPVPASLFESTRVRPDLKAPRSKVRRWRSAALVSFSAVLVLGAAIWTANSLLSSSGPGPPPTPDRITLDPIPMGTASLYLDIHPEVEVVIRVDGEALEGGIPKKPPISIDPLTPGREHRIEILADGHQPYTFSATLEAGAEKTQDVRLQAEAGAIHPDAGNDAGKGPEIPSRVSVPKPSRSPRRTGTLKVNSDAPSTVFIDSKRYGDTPVEVRLAPGVHWVVLLARDGQLTPRRRIVIKPGKRNEITYK